MSAKFSMISFISVALLVSAGSAFSLSDDAPSSRNRGWMRASALQGAFGVSKASGSVWMVSAFEGVLSLGNVFPLSNLALGFALLDFNGPTTGPTGRYSWLAPAAEILLLSKVQALDHEHVTFVPADEPYIRKSVLSDSVFDTIVSSLRLYASGSAWAGVCAYPFWVESDFKYNCWYVKYGVRFEQMLKLGREPLSYSTHVRVGLDAGVMVAPPGDRHDRPRSVYFLLATIRFGDFYLLPDNGDSPYSRPMSMPDTRPH